MDKSCKNFLIILYASVRWLLEVVDLGLDWDFYIEVINTDQQSIIRAVNLKWAIFGFAVFGTLMFLSTLIVFCIKIHKKRKQINLNNSYKNVKKAVSVISLICTWVEDLPQILLAVVVAVKSTELISNVQLVKAWYALVEASLQAIITLIELRLCCHNKPDHWKRVLSVCELIGIVLIFLFSVFLLIELYQDYFKEIYPLENTAMNVTTNITTWSSITTTWVSNITTWSTPITST